MASVRKAKSLTLTIKLMMQREMDFLWWQRYVDICLADIWLVFHSSIGVNRCFFR